MVFGIYSLLLYDFCVLNSLLFIIGYTRLSDLGIFWQIFVTAFGLAAVSCVCQHYSWVANAEEGAAFVLQQVIGLNQKEPWLC